MWLRMPVLAIVLGGIVGCSNQQVIDQQVIDRIDQLEAERRFWKTAVVAVLGVVVGGVAGLLVGGPTPSAMTSIRHVSLSEEN